MSDLSDSPVTHRVRASGEGVPLLQYLQGFLPGVPDAEIKEAVAQGRFRSNDGAALAADALLTTGQVLLADVPGRSPEDPFLPPPPERLHELFRDQHLVAVCKPAGLLCHPMGVHKVAALAIMARTLREDGESDELRPLHRLDRETSGVLLMARDLHSDVHIKKQFVERSIAKSYLALVRGHLAQDEVLVDAPIAADDGPIRVRMRVHSSGKTAQTLLRPIAHFGNDDFGQAGRGYTWVRASPRTGRTHQVRVHLAHIGHPLVGDKLYCGNGEAFLKKWHGTLGQDDIDELGLPRHALHAEAMTLEHPRSGEPLRLRAPRAEDMAEFAHLRGGAWPAP